MNKDKLFSIIKRHRNSGLNHIEIAAQLNKDGIKTVQGKQWSAMLISSFLRNRGIRTNKPYARRKNSLAKTANVTVVKTAPQTTKLVADDIMNILTSNVPNDLQLRILKALL